MEEVIAQQIRDQFDARVDEVFESRARTLARRTDRMFLILFGAQWIIAISIALALSPKTWSGGLSAIHMHVFAAIFLGGALALLPICAYSAASGTLFSRSVNAVTQMMFSMLFIHLTGGRIESHFHIFGSLAFLAFYRDWRPVVIATIITGLDHIVRGVIWPDSVYGVTSFNAWRALEHVAWVLFEDAFLLIAIRTSALELVSNVYTEVELERTVQAFDTAMAERNSHHATYPAAYY